MASNKKNIEQASALVSQEANSAPFVRPIENQVITDVGGLIDGERSLYQRLFDAMPSAVIYLDEKGIIAKYNHAASDLFKIDLQDKRWSDVIEEQFSPQSDDGHEISLKDGTRVHIETCSIPSITGQLIVITDLTRTRQWQEAHNQQQRLCEMGTMVSELAHQIRTPVASALLYCGNLPKIRDDAKRSTDYINKISHKLKQIEQQVSDMLIFAKSGKTILEKISVSDVVSILRDAVAADLIAYNSLAYFNNSTENLVLVCNVESLVSSLRNCIINAFEACRINGRVTVAVKRAEADMVDIVVIDDGPGMEPEMQAKVFTPFFTTKSSGTGLGLGVVNAVATAHQGRVIFESTPGLGTKVGVRLPIHRQEA